MADADTERKHAKKPRQRWSDEKRSRFRRLMRPLQLGAMVFVLAELAVLYLGAVVFHFTPLPVLAIMVMGMGVYLWFFLQWFRRFRLWKKDWDEPD